MNVEVRSTWYYRLDSNFFFLGSKILILVSLRIINVGF